jgi:hypothetical protein
MVGSVEHVQTSYEAAVKTVNAFKEGIVSIYNKIGCGTDETPGQLGRHTDPNTLQRSAPVSRVSFSFPFRFRFVSVSFPFRFRFVSVSFPFRFRFVSVSRVSFPFRFRFVSVSFPFRFRFLNGDFHASHVVYLSSLRCGIRYLLLLRLSAVVPKSMFAPTYPTQCCAYYVIGVFWKLLLTFRQVTTSFRAD